MEISDLIAVGALVVSALAYLQTRKASKSQQQLTSREVELVRIQLNREQEKERAEKTANVSARLVRIDRKTWRLKVFNAGPSVAHNVRLLLDDQNLIIREQFASDKFPMTKLEKGQSVDVVALVHKQTNPKELLCINWEDGTGKVQENKVEITI